MRKPIFLVLWFASVVAAGAVAQDSGTPADMQEAIEHFSKAAFRANMAFLADDLL